MKKRWLADGILASSVVLTLGAAPFQGESPWLAGVFHMSFAAAVGGFADWFGVTSLFRRPLGISWRTDLIAKNRDMIVSIAKDMVVNELLTRGRLSEILRQHVPSDVVAHWLTVHRDLTEKLAALGIRVRALSSYYHDQSEDLHCLVINYSGLKEERLAAALAAISQEWT